MNATSYEGTSSALSTPAVQCLQCPIASALACELEELRAVVADIALGATMMKELRGNASLVRYAAEVHRVATAAISEGK